MSNRAEWLAFASDVHHASWIEKALAPQFGTVGSLIPSGFESYVRIFHPAEDPSGGFVTWLEISKARHRPLTPTIQWNDLISSKGLASTSPSGMAEPERGSLHPVLFNSVCEVLRDSTTQPVRCFYGLWTGRTEVWSEARVGEPTQSGHREDSRSTADLDGTIFEPWPNKGRQYLLLEGAIVSAGALAAFVGMDEAFWMSPNFVWSQERSWCLATDIDQDSTLVGGPKAMTEAIMASPQIEALPISLGDPMR